MAEKDLMVLITQIKKKTQNNYSHEIAKINNKLFSGAMDFLDLNRKSE